MTTNPMNDKKSKWTWRQTHWDNFQLIRPNKVVYNYRSYLDLCWACGTLGITAKEG